MNSTIYKYPLPVTGLPKGARVLSAGLDPSNKLCIWAEVDPNAPLVDRQILLFGTGHELPSPTAIFIATVKDGPFMIHVYDQGETA